MGNYEVKAELVIDDKRARKAIARIQKSLGGLIKQLNAVNKKMALMGKNMKKADGMGQRPRKGPGRGSAGAGSYLVAGAAAGALMGGARFLSNQIAAASEFRKEMEMGQLGLATMYNIVDKMPLDGAMSRASDQMIKFNTMAAEAPGSGQDMMSIYTRLYGPMKKLGVATKDIEEAVKGSAVMGKAFGIKDVGSLGRDVEEMLTGRAGKRTTKIFALANAWGILNMGAKEFNALAPEKRLKITQDLIAKFSPLGKMMAKTWEGSSEAFAGWINIIRDFAASGVFDELGRQLYDINQMIERNLPKIKGYMTLASEAMGGRVGGVMNVAKAGATSTGLNPIMAGQGAIAGGMVAAIGALVVGFHSLAGIMGTTGPLVSALGWIVSGSFALVMGKLAVLAAFFVAVFDVMTMEGGKFGAAWMTVLGALMGPVLHVIISLFFALVEIFKVIIQVLSFVLIPILAYAAASLMVLVGALMVVVELVRAVATTFSTLLGMNADFETMTSNLKIFMLTMKTMVAGALGAIGSLFDGILGLLHPLISLLGMKETGLELRLAKAVFRTEIAEAQKRVLDMDFTMPDFGNFGDGEVIDGDAPGGGSGKFQAPAEINVQRMIINQDFKGKADPDRVVAAFLGAVASQAEGAISSPNEPTNRA